MEAQQNRPAQSKRMGEVGLEGGLFHVVSAQCKLRSVGVGGGRLVLMTSRRIEAEFSGSTDCVGASMKLSNAWCVRSVRTFPLFSTPATGWHW
jgi:hypothetical protein